MAKRPGWMAWMVLAVAVAMSSQVARAADVGGKWVAEITSPSLLEPAYARVTLEHAGDTLSGTWGTNTIKGTVSGATVKWTVTDAEGREAGTMTSCPCCRTPSVC